MPPIPASLLLCCGLVSAANGAQADTTVRVACVGDSITFGAGVEPRERSCYPALLDHLLGEGYEVRNFGVSGATLLSHGDLPYVDQPAYRQALEWQPQVVVIMLGTNDTKPHNWERRGAFVDDYTDLVESFQALDSEPRVLLALPVPAFGESFGISETRVRQGVLPMVRGARERAGAELVDLHSPLVDHPEYFPDGVHPNAFGAEVMARTVFEALRRPGLPDPNYAALAMPSVEFRGQAAGWGGGTWWDQLDAINAIARQHGEGIGLLFLGDSITQGWTGAADRLAVEGGGRLFDRLYARHGAASFGISGDRTQHVLYRIRNGNLAGLSPKVVVLMIGVNNLGPSPDSGEDIAEGTLAIAGEIGDRCPDAHVVLLGSLPRGAEPDTWAREQIDLLHKRLAAAADSDRVHYLDIRSHFLNADGTASESTMAPDAIHLTPAGYEAWAEAMAPTLERLLGG
jgi:lysophospholipase L1-like esterase